MPVPFTALNLCLCAGSKDVWLKHMSSSGVMLAYSLSMCARRKPHTHGPAVVALGHALVHVLPLAMQQRNFRQRLTRSQAYSRACVCLALLWLWNMDTTRPRAYGYHKRPAQWRWVLLAYCVGVLASAKTATRLST